MVMPKRLSGSRKVVAMCDPALSNFPQLKTKKLDNGQEVPSLGLIPYGATLDIEYLGNLDELPFGGPTVFEVMPLQTKFAHWDKGDESDYQMIFQSHVIKIENFDAERELVMERLPGFDYKTIDDKSMELIPLSFVKDIGNVILQLAKCDGNTIPFSMLGTSTDILRRCRAAQHLNLSHAIMGVVKNSV